MHKWIGYFGFSEAKTELKQKPLELNSASKLTFALSAFAEIR